MKKILLILAEEPGSNVGHPGYKAMVGHDVYRPIQTFEEFKRGLERKNPEWEEWECGMQEKEWVLKEQGAVLEIQGEIEVYTFGFCKTINRASKEILNLRTGFLDLIRRSTDIKDWDAFWGSLSPDQQVDLMRSHNISHAFIDHNDPAWGWSFMMESWLSFWDEPGTPLDHRQRLDWFLDRGGNLMEVNSGGFNIPLLSLHRDEGELSDYTRMLFEHPDFNAQETLERYQFFSGYENRTGKILESPEAVSYLERFLFEGEYLGLGGLERSRKKL